jgi:hypothetical protein
VSGIALLVAWLPGRPVPGRIVPSRIVPGGIVPEVDDDVDLGVDAVHDVDDRVQSLLQLGEPGSQVAVVSGGLGRILRQPAVEHRVEMLPGPAQRFGKRFQGSRIPPPLDPVPLNFPDGGHGYVRMHREITLAQFKLAHTPGNGLGNRDPILRHEFLRAPLRRKISGLPHSSPCRRHFTELPGAGIRFCVEFSAETAELDAN